MNSVSSAIAERARKNERVVLHALASTGQRHVADQMGVSESTVSRFKEALIAQFCLFLATLGLKVVPITMKCFEPQYVHALQVLAGVGLKNPEPQVLDWSEH